MRILTAVFLLLAIMVSACQSGYKPENLDGKWQAIAITEEETPLAVDPSEIQLQFNTEEQY
ncbi:MAG: hypothetical protein KI786_19875, partial [Mameliella sp.]|nr:hypothetical protein [Phaeodactylibacter sp.]